MGRHNLNKAEQDFFGALSDDTTIKVAAGLEQDTMDALGISTVSPSILSKLEAEASGAPQEEPAPVKQEPTAPQPAAPAADVDEFERKDTPPKTEPVPEPDLPTRTTHGKLFTDKRAHPLQLLDVLTMSYNTDWVDWESSTLWWSIRRGFGPIGEVVRNKIMALRMAVTTDVPWLDWDTFEDCGLSWNDIVPTFGSYQPMTPMQAAFAVQTLKGIRPEDELAHEVLAYIAAILDDHGWLWAPEEWFGGAQEILERGRIDQVGLKNEIISAWKQVQDVDPTTIEWREEDPKDIHVLKLFVVKRYLEERDATREDVPGGPSAASTVSPPVP